MYVRIHPSNPQSHHLTQAIEVLRSGGVIIYPTDTVYGIGCSIFDSSAVERVYQIRHGSTAKPYSFLCSDLSNIAEYAKVSNPAYRLMKGLIPGPFTFILPASRLKQLPRGIVSARKTVGIRVPENNICRELVKGLGHPILSAGLFSENDDVVTDPELIKRQYEKQVDLIIDGGLSQNEFSTVLDLTKPQPVVVRHGLGDIGAMIIEEETVSAE
jgi:tRNA threonylcarbamoyl adenosine modification protein (Sua5/YciO/YrdC/YwlC family)